jgi:hypothetical protein
VHAGERRIHGGLAADSGDQWTWFFFFFTIWRGCDFSRLDNCGIVGEGRSLIDDEGKLVC